MMVLGEDAIEKTTEWLNDRRQGKHPALGAPYGKQTLIKVDVFNPLAMKPTRGTPESAGYDLFSTVDYTLLPGETVLIPLGFRTEMHPDVHGRIESRSGMAVSGLVVLTGVIDSDYRGEWKVILHNVSNEAKMIAIGQRVAQVVLRPTLSALWDVSEVSESARGHGGFGSTGL